VLAGHIHVSEDVFERDSLKQPSGKKAGALDLLTDSELEVLELLGHGKSSKEISPTRLVQCGGQCTWQQHPPEA
jgi:DNA-binding NarL/FixJ family response regulator